METNWKQNNTDRLVRALSGRVAGASRQKLYSTLTPSQCASREMQKSSVDSMASLSDLQKELTSLSLRASSPRTRSASTEVRQTGCIS